MQMREKLRINPVEGDIGIEIELEGRDLPDGGFGHWRSERDGSLRGHSVELVLKEPCPRELVSDRLKEVNTRLEKLGSFIEDSGRAGLHVHVNIQKLTDVQLVNFICLYMVFENTLVEWCGDRRVGNLFCLRTCDASGYMEVLRRCVTSGNWGTLGTDEVRYASMNLKAIPQYGSLEFRAMRSTVDAEDIQVWVNLLLALRDRAQEYDNPIQIVERFSVDGPETLFTKTFGPLHDALQFSAKDMLDGIRNAQWIAYCRNSWEEGVIRKEEEDKDVALDVIQVIDLVDALHEAMMDGRHVVDHEGMMYYYIFDMDDMDEREDLDVGMRWFSATEVCELAGRGERGALQDEWEEWAMEVCNAHYLHHARAFLSKKIKREALAGMMNPLGEAVDMFRNVRIRQ